MLCGIEVRPADRPRFDAAIAALGYPCFDETDNPAYRLFLDNASTTSALAAE